MGPRPRISASRSHTKWEGTAIVPGTTQRSKESNFRLKIYSLQLWNWNVTPPGATMASWIETEHPRARKGISWEFPLWKVNDASTRSKLTSSVAVVVSQFCFDSSLSPHGNNRWRNQDLFCRFLAPGFWRSNPVPWACYAHALLLSCIPCSVTQNLECWISVLVEFQSVASL